MAELPPDTRHGWVHRAIFVGGVTVLVVLLIALLQGCAAAMHVP
jgi:hypothetical protein